MTNPIDAIKKGYWSLKAPYFLLKAQNCAITTLEVFQDMTSNREDLLSASRPAAKLKRSKRASLACLINCL